MGAIIELPATAEPFRAELRRESFYLHTGMDGRPLPGRLDEPWTPGTPDYGQVTIPMDLIPAFRAALEDVTRQARQYSGLDDVTSRGQEVWTVDVDHLGLLITGPAYLYGLMDSGTQWGPVGQLEIEYADLQGLRDAIGLVLD